MAEKTREMNDNPFFIYYGNLADKCFAPDMMSGGDIAVFPNVIKGIKHLSDVGGDPTKKFEAYADASELKFVQKSVDDLRNALIQESMTPPPAGDPSAARNAYPLTNKLKEFRIALKKGNEAMLEENPFYELTGLIYRLNMTALKNAFVEELKKAPQNPPRPIKVSRTLRQIWGSKGEIISLGQKFYETAGKIVSVGKMTLGFLLFIGSTLTTAKGMNDLVQLPGFVELFGNGMVGSENEISRMILCLFSGLVLSSFILDFKSRLFQGIAEVGSILRGIYLAFRRNPRWIFLSCFLTLISIWTNYDGIVLLMSKKEDLSWQLKKIQRQVETAIGDPANPNPDDPASLMDLKAMLNKRVAEAVKQFEQVPVDEMSGSASSGVARKGPRYWGKYFVVHGGFEAGKQDVAHNSRSKLAWKIDNMLKKGNLTLSIEEEMNQIIETYSRQLDQTRASVQRRTSALEKTMSLQSYSLDELYRVFSLESYHINQSVQKVVGEMEANKDQFAEAVAAINALAASRTLLLQKVDKSGTVSGNKYNINITIDIPDLSAIDQLKKGQIPKAKRRNLAELKDTLLERYGMGTGGLILIIILFIAISMDLSDPIFYSAMVARWGRRDRHFLNENIERFRQWEDAFIRNIRSFLVRPDISPILPKLPHPKISRVHYIYHQFLEGLNPILKDQSSLTRFEQFRFWFLGLFGTTRISYVAAYNARQTVTMRIVNDPKNHGPKLLNQVFPGVLDHFRIGIDHFDLLFEKVLDKTALHDHRFNSRLYAVAEKSGVAAAAGIRPTEESQADGQDKEPSKPEAGKPETPEKEGAQSKKFPEAESAGGIMTGALDSLREWIFLIFWKPLAGGEAPFPLARLSWLKTYAITEAKSRADINYLANFSPFLTHFLSDRLPQLKRGPLAKLVESLDKIPNTQALERALDIQGMRDELDRLEKSLTEVLGLTQFQGFQISGKILLDIFENADSSDIAAVFLHHQMDASGFEKIADQLEGRLLRAERLITSIVAEQDNLIYKLTRIRRDNLTPLNSTLSHLENRAVIEESLGIREMSNDLVAIENFLLEMWDPATLSVGLSSMADTGLYSDSLAQCDVSSDQDSSIRAFFATNPETGEFVLFEKVDQLESRVAETYQKVNSVIFVLTFIDKTTIKLRRQIDESLKMLETVIGKDSQLGNLQMGAQPIDPKKFSFLADNRLFFRSVPLQLNTIKGRLNSLLGDPKLTEKHNVELLRSLESQTFKLHNFLKNTVDYLDGKRDGAGLSAALTQMGVRPQLAGRKPREPFKFNQATAQSVHPGTPKAMIEKTRENCAGIKRILMDVSLREWDMLKEPIPPEEHVQLLKTSRPMLDHAAIGVETILASLDEDQADVNTSPTNPERMGRLLNLKCQSEAILKKLEVLNEKVNKPFFVDRRSDTAWENEREAKTEKKDVWGRVVEEVSEEAADDQGTPGTEDKPRGSSRRVAERVVLKSQIEISAPGRGSVIGRTQDVSARGICLEAESMPDELQAGMNASFRLLSDSRNTTFSCRLLRITGRNIILTIDEGQETNFISLIRDEMVKEPSKSGHLLNTIIVPPQA
ncbi:MAG: PilZ domain-containing protein [Magnetococcales bacterium]|nr:PilZ domain-containing protein [Magnetococcales bacterium]